MQVNSLEEIWAELGIGDAELARNKLSRCEQPALNDLEVVEIDFEGKPFILTNKAARAWREIREVARSAHVQLEPFSGFRSYLYQKELINKKLAKGQSLQMILRQVAIPGFSEHHTGCAIDVCTEGRYELEERFENTAAFMWLTENAGRFNFRLSYPRDNNSGIIYEPWHWFFVG